MLQVSCWSLPFSRWTWVNWYQNVSILDIIGAKDDGSGGDNCSCNTCKALVRISAPTNQHPDFLQAGCPSCRRTNSVQYCLFDRKVCMNFYAYAEVAKSQTRASLSTVCQIAYKNEFTKNHFPRHRCYPDSAMGLAVFPDHLAGILNWLGNLRLPCGCYQFFSCYNYSYRSCVGIHCAGKVRVSKLMVW